MLRSNERIWLDTSKACLSFSIINMLMTSFWILQQSFRILIQTESVTLTICVFLSDISICQQFTWPWSLQRQLSSCVLEMPDYVILIFDWQMTSVRLRNLDFWKCCLSTDHVTLITTLTVYWDVLWKCQMSSARLRNSSLDYVILNFDWQMTSGRLRNLVFELRDDNQGSVYKANTNSKLNI